MTAITHAVTEQGAQVWNSMARLVRAAGDGLNMLNAAVRVARAIEMHQQPNQEDLEVLRIPTPLPRFY